MSRLRRPHAALAVLALLTALLAARNVGGAAELPRATDGLYNAIELGAVLLCAWRAATFAGERRAWICMTVAMASFAAGDLYWLVAFSGMPADDIPYPSVGDALYLGFYPAAYLGLGLLVRARSGQTTRVQWLDGVIAALAAAAVAGAFGFERLVEAGDGDVLAIATNLAYPLADLVLLSVVAALLTVFGPGARATWATLAAALLVFAVADTIYLDQVAAGAYVENGLLDVAWPAALVLFAWAAWQRPATAQERRLRGLRALVVPAAAGLAALAVLVLDHFVRVSDLTLALATAALLAFVARFAVTFVASQRLLAASEIEARTDHLTGLANRRELVAALQWMAERRWPGVVALYDLDGFKSYNDRFGHLAGDALLQRLGHRLERAVTPEGGRAFRIGGDEFCVIVPVDGAAALLAAAERALADRGDGFEIRASGGSARMPADAATPAAALALVDERMYAAKGRGRASVVGQARDVLMRAVHERKPDLGGHVDDVAGLAVELAREMGLGEGAVEDVRAAAELHDVGKLAIPDSILDKPGPLDDEEWAFMRRHTIVGERILLAAPALAGVAPLVRSSHERWDGLGYPDGLAGERIPLGARIVSLCDAWDAMVADRPYQAARTAEQALAELRRCAGSQFDPAVVAAFERLLARRRERAFVG